jgi:c-di-AMP phosphodiesterase-like protein
VKEREVFSEKIETYFEWPILISLALIFINGIVYIANAQLGLYLSIFTVTIVAVSITVYLFYRNKLINYLIEFCQSYDYEQKLVMDKFGIPLALIDKSAKIKWNNDMFGIAIEVENAIGKSITNYISEITKEALPKEERTEILYVSMNGKYYRIELKKVSIREMVDSNIEGKKSRKGNIIIYDMFIVNLFDETEAIELSRKLKEQRLVSGLIYIDNFEEATQSIEDVRRPLLIALIDRNINKFANNIDAVLRKMEKDRYFIVFQQKYLPQLQESKFSLLDDIRKIDIGNDMAVTLSMGIGLSAETYAQSNEYSKTALDLALGRGGDQVVVKDGNKILYYGGNKNQLIDKVNRVKARVKAHALKELLEESEKVIIMGHRLSDMDSLGSAIGLYRGAKQLNKKAHIVLNETTTAVKALYDLFESNSEYEDDMFLNNSEAIEAADTKTLLIVVDVSRPGYVECKELLDKVQNIVVIDHHRQSNDSIENPVLSYIEPHASSTSEMVTEILQYLVDKLRLRPIEADALFAGITVDTKNFMSKTGVNTFEAAAYLRKAGADVVRVRKLFRNDLASYRAKAATISEATIYKNIIAIGRCPWENIDSPTIVAAQAADELLNIQGIKASFVVTKVDTTVFISARSIDEINVQVIMERLGGGGHLNVAGAQLENVSIDEAINKINILLDEMSLEGELK